MQNVWLWGALACASAPLFAQIPVSAAIPAPLAASADSQNPALKPNPIDALRKFEPAADEEYRLGKGDEITVDYTGRPEMQSRLVIGPDGRVSLPLAGEVMLANLTRNEAAGEVVKSLSPYYTNLAAQVTVTKYTANRVLVLGAVEKPGPVLFDGQPTLLEAVTRVGLPTTETMGQKRPQIPDTCAIYRGSDQVMWVQLRELVDSGNPMADLRLRRGDVVYIPDPNERFVSVLGEVNHPGAVPLTHSTTLASVLAAAGGIGEKAGHNPHVQVIDPATGTKRIIEFKDLLNPGKGLEATLKPGELIYVPRSGFARATYYLERLSPLINAATVAAWQF
jgi:polysaccharide export outer membrane protein